MLYNSAISVGQNQNLSGNYVGPDSCQSLFCACNMLLMHDCIYTCMVMETNMYHYLVIGCLAVVGQTLHLP